MLSFPKIVNIVESEADENRGKMHVTTKKHRTRELVIKLSSRHGQKNVVGVHQDEEDMPFNDDGIHPYIVINSYAILSRMTVGPLLGSVLVRSAAMSKNF